MLYLTLVVFFFFLLVIWFVVKLLFKLEKRDTFTFDRLNLWEHHKISKEEMQPPKQKKR